MEVDMVITRESGTGMSRSEVLGVSARVNKR